MEVLRCQSIDPQTIKIVAEAEALQLNGQPQQALQVITKGLQQIANKPDNLAYLYAHQSGLYVSVDSLVLGKKALDKCIEHARTSQSPEAKAVSQRAKAYMYLRLGQPDEAAEAAMEGLGLLEQRAHNEKIGYYLNYLLYRVYSGWGDFEKMEKYILTCERYAAQLDNKNLLVNAFNGHASMYLTKWRSTKQQVYADSSFQYLLKSLAVHRQDSKDVAVNNFVITCVNIANHFLEYADNSLDQRKKRAFAYLDSAVYALRLSDSHSSHWINIMGIKAGFALEENNFSVAEAYLLEGLAKIADDQQSNRSAEMNAYQHLAAIASKKKDFQSALNYQRKATSIQQKIFDQRQIFNAQKLEVQYETEKKNREMAVLKERSETRRRQNYLYGTLAAVSLLGLVFMFLSYHFKLRYSVEREEKLAKEKEESERNARMQVQLEKEEQARLKAEQELLELRQQQLQKEVMANNLMIDHKNEMLKRIQSEIVGGDRKQLQKLLKKEALLSIDFEETRSHIQQLHPDFFSRLTEKAVQKLTPLDLKYCSYIHLKMSSQQIAQLLHVETQSVRMFKYRLKRKFGLPKATSLEVFLQEI